MLGACERPAVVVFLRKPSRVGDLGRRRFDPCPECTTEAEETVNAARIAGEGQWNALPRSRSRWPLLDRVCALSDECLGRECPISSFSLPESQLCGFWTLNFCHFRRWLVRVESILTIKIRLMDEFFTP